MKVATFNVNGVRARIDLVRRFLERHEPDVLCLQETKVSDQDFPADVFTGLGYALTIAGEPAYNGVAIVSRRPISDVVVGLHGDGPETNKRAITCTVDGTRVACVYVPNGKDVVLPTFLDKLRWLERLRLTLDTRSEPEQALVVCGDFNVARDERDVYDPERFRGRLLFHPDERAALARVLGFGLFDAYRHFHGEGGRYTWWDYRGGDFRANRGLRIDYVFVTARITQRLRRAEILLDPRGESAPSDHAPVLVEFDE